MTRAASVFKTKLSCKGGGRRSFCCCCCCCCGGCFSFKRHKTKTSLRRTRMDRAARKRAVAEDRERHRRLRLERENQKQNKKGNRENYKTGAGAWDTPAASSHVGWTGLIVPRITFLCHITNAKDLRFNLAHIFQYLSCARICFAPFCIMFPWV